MFASSLEGKMSGSRTRFGVVLLLAIPLLAFAQAMPSSVDVAGSHSQGAEIATQFAKATGVAITPLLGMSFLGASSWLRAPAEMRPMLPWYDQPFFWGTGLVLIGILWFGHRIPVIKRGFKFIKVWESKVSAVVAIAAVGQSIVAAIQTAPAPTARFSPGEWLIGSAHAANDALQVGQIVDNAGTTIATLVCLLAGALVWLMFHTVNVLVLVSPIGVVDWILKGGRLAALGVLLLALVINPWLGAFVSLVYALAALVVAGWAFRLMVFGAVFTADFALLRWRWQQLENDGNDGNDGIDAFSESGMAVPIHTWGRIHTDASGIVFRFRPFLVLSLKEVRVDAPLFIENGLLSPLLMSGATAAGGKEAAVVRFPPRYRGHGAMLMTALGVAGEREVGLQHGTKAAFAWIRDQFKRGPSLAGDLEVSLGLPGAHR
jgi:hypothetical protein